MKALEKLKKWVKKSFNGILKEKIIAEIDRLQSEEEVCEWFYDKYLGYYRMDCDYDVIPENHNYIFCPYCGRKIKEV